MESQRFLFVLLISLLALNVSALRQNEAFNRYLKARRSSSITKTAGFKESPEQLPAVQSQEGLKEKDRILRLPGQPPVKFNQYGGYITVNESAGRALYYYFVEADQSPEKAKKSPLVLWLNGGPGCSSLGYGAMEEIGPFRVGSDGKILFKNEFAWNKVANILFLESSAGVGFSYSNGTNVTGDSMAATDNLFFMLNWLERFPEYRTRDFFITGESYAGHYVPQLASYIMNYNNKARNSTSINLKGIMIGNGILNDETDTLGQYEYWESHALISPETLQGIKKSCDLTPNANVTDECIRLLDSADNLYREIDVYNIYYPRCIKDIEGKNKSAVLTSKPKPFSITNYDPCSDDYVVEYRNRPEVQVAMHANVTGINYPWTFCSDSVLKNWNEYWVSLLPTLKELLEKGIRVLKYSGDVDGRVPITATLKSLAAMKVPIKKPWSPWYLSGEVGGFTLYYEGNLSLRVLGELVTPSQATSLNGVFHFLRISSLTLLFLITRLVFWFDGICLGSHIFIISMNILQVDL